MPSEQSVSLQQAIDFFYDIMHCTAGFLYLRIEHGLMHLFIHFSRKCGQ